MNLLVTGGAGFIGSNFVKKVLSKGLSADEYKVTVLDALTYAGNKKNFPKDIWDNPNFTFIEGNILDRDLVFRIMDSQDTVVHFAAYTHIDRSIDLSDPFVDTDFKGTHILLEAARHTDIKRFIHISTSEVYGSAIYAPMDEEHPIKPQSPYAAAKAGADRLVYSYYVTYNLPCVIIRPFNNYGYNQYPEKLIPYFITNALDGKSLPIYGSGENTRDWLWVEDCVDGIIKALDVDGSRIEGKVINLGTGEDFSVNYIAEKILEILGKDRGLIGRVSDRPGHVKRLVASYGKAKTLLGWQPVVEFDEGLKRTVDWYVENREWWEEIKTREEFKTFERNWYGFLRRNL
ncbi:MAG: dTDP-glucose 4,6-dehydratase [candidate division WOR-3 bacterium]|nr:dTDP-glucose 4,6-dehydratase [candidate division WOR-3 bacterium]